MFTKSGREKSGFSDKGTPRKPYCTALPTMSRVESDWSLFVGYLQGRGIDPGLAKYNAWYPSRQAGDDHLRVVMPATSQDQNNHFWQARLIDGPGEPRYQSPHAARGDALIVAHPRLHPDLAPAGTVLVEGPVDALAAAELGFIGVALMGNTPTAEVLDHAVGWLKSYPPALLVTDTDAVAQGAALAQKLIGRHGLLSLRILSPYPHKDLAEMTLSIRRTMFIDGGVQV